MHSEASIFRQKINHGQSNSQNGNGVNKSFLEALCNCSNSNVRVDLPEVAISLNSMLELEPIP